MSFDVSIRCQKCGEVLTDLSPREAASHIRGACVNWCRVYQVYWGSFWSVMSGEALTRLVNACGSLTQFKVNTMDITLEELDEIRTSGGCKA